MLNEQKINDLEGNLRSSLWQLLFDEAEDPCEDAYNQGIADSMAEVAEFFDELRGIYL